MGLLKAQSSAVNGKPVPVAPTASMKPSPAAMAWLPEATSLMVALTRTDARLLLWP